MRTKSPPPSEPEERGLARRALYSDEAYWVSVAAKLTGVSMHEFISQFVREPVRKLLVSRGIDPDRDWAKYAAGRNGE